jgi:hypothetical protein
MFPKHATILLLAFLVTMPRIVQAQDSGTHRTGYPADLEPPSAPVVLDGEVLFTVRGVSAYPAAQRADAIAGRIRAMADDPNLRVDALQVVEADGVARLMISDVISPALCVWDSRLGIIEPRFPRRHVKRPI